MFLIEATSDLLHVLPLPPAMSPQASPTSGSPTKLENKNSFATYGRNNSISTCAPRVVLVGSSFVSVRGPLHGRARQSACAAESCRTHRCRTQALMGMEQFASSIAPLLNALLRAWRQQFRGAVERRAWERCSERLIAQSGR